DVTATPPARATNDTERPPPAAGAGRIFTFQNTAPAVAIAQPSDSGRYNAASLTPLSGTSLDAVSGVTAVQVLLKSAILGYWNAATSGTVADGDNSPSRYT